MSTSERCSRCSRWNAARYRQPRNSWGLFWLCLVALALGCVAGFARPVWVSTARASQPENTEISGDEQAADEEEERQATDSQQRPTPPFTRRVPAPALDGGGDWVNTDHPLSISDLHGKFVLLDFWTYCCINCIHVLPELKKLEKAYPHELVVIGVHSAKFEGEKDIDNIREAVLRYEIEHPVVNDAEMTIWNRYGIRSWPSMALIDPEGQLVGITSGEKTFEQLNQIMQFALPYYQEQRLIDRTPIHFALERDKLKPQPLLFPGKVLADEAGERLFIADSNHNRIVISDLQGRVIDIIGNGSIGRENGNYEESTFDHPQGMALVDRTLYVADTENHLIRTVDLESRRVATVAGTGFQARGPWPMTESATADGSPSIKWAGPPATTALNSPWALLIHKDVLYIAMAGPHQIWRMALDGDHIEIHAGNGREDIVDGPLVPSQPYEPGFSSFAQPSGLASDGQSLYVADTEGSSIRSVPFDTSLNVETVVGTSRLAGGRLFAFGDRDGQGLLEVKVPALGFRADPDQTSGPLLQHAMGVAFYGGKLYVADTYNNKIKVIDPASRECHTLAGTGDPGQNDGPATEATFDEPAGLSAANGKLFVADTNNHLIRVIDLNDGYRVETMAMKGLRSPE